MWDHQHRHFAWICRQIAPWNPRIACEFGGKKTSPKTIWQNQRKKLLEDGYLKAVLGLKFYDFDDFDTFFNSKLFFLIWYIALITFHSSSLSGSWSTHVRGPLGEGMGGERGEGGRKGGHSRCLDNMAHSVGLWVLRVTRVKVTFDKHSLLPGYFSTKWWKVWASLSRSMRPHQHTFLWSGLLFSKLFKVPRHKNGDNDWFFNFSGPMQKETWHRTCGRSRNMDYRRSVKITQSK